MDGIFISYRREDSAGYAGRLYDRLAAHFGADRVFMDVEGIDPGTDFVDALENAVLSCKVLIVLIGSEWIDANDEHGRRRLDDPNDFIRIETGTALQRDIRVVPVLLDGAPMPRADELPEELATLCRRQAVEVRHKQWEATTGKLIETLDKIYLTDAPQGGAATAASASAAVAAEHSASGRRRFLAWTVAGVSSLGLVFADTWLVLRTLPEASTVPADKAVPAEMLTAGSDKPRARLVLVPRRVDFGRVEVGGEGSARVTLRNAGDGDAVISAPQLDVSTADSVSFQSQCPEILPASAECVIELRFAPRTAGPLDARFGVTQEGEAAEEVALSGKAVKQPRVLTAATGPTVKTLPPVAAATASAEAIVTGTRVDERAADIGSESVAAKARPTKESEAAVKSALDDNLPRPGDRWVYRIRGRWANIPQRTIEVSLRAADRQKVQESLVLLDGEARRPLGQRNVHGRVAQILQSEAMGTEFNPYFAAFAELREDARWGDIPTPDSDSFWTNWHSKGEVKGSETVRVPAGEFHARKVEIWSSRSSTGSATENHTEPVRVRYQIWYAPAVKRYIKMVRAVTAKVGQTMDKDTVELESYRQQ